MDFNQYFRRFMNTNPGIGPNEPDPPDLIRETKDWRGLFDPNIVTKASNALWQRQISDLRYNDYSCSARVHSGNSRHFVKILHAPVNLKGSWKDAIFSCTCADAAYHGKYCIHMAAVMCAWESRRGPWVFKESVYDYARRKEEEKRQSVLAHKESLKKKYGMKKVPADQFFDKLPRMSGLVFWDIEAAVRECTTTPYAIARAGELDNALLRGSEMYYMEDGRDGRSMNFSCSFKDEPEWASVSGVLLGGKLMNLKSISYHQSFIPSSQTGPFDPAKPLDEYQLQALKKLWNHLLSANAGDPTDTAAETFFKAMDNLSVQAAEAAQQDAESPLAKEKVLTLFPRIIIEDGKATLSFKLGRKGSRLFILRNLSNLVSAYQNSEENFSLTKKETIDFTRLDFTEESEPMMQFIMRRVGEIKDVNKQLTSKPSNYYTRVSTLSVSSNMILEGSLLDGFYDIAEGGKCDYQDKTNNIAETVIPIGHRNLKIDLKADRLSDARGAFAGVEVSGLIPVMIKGSIANYVLNDRGLSRISAEEKQVLAPFSKVADASGFFRFRVGMNNLQEFYYRALPRLLDNPYVRLEDNVGGEQEQYLPPEPAFTFLIDYDEPDLLCRAKVAYDDKEYDIPATSLSSGSDEYRDRLQENRVVNRIEKWFPAYDPSEGEYVCETDNDKLYDFLTRGIAELEQYGTVKGTAPFARQKIRPMSSVRVGVSVKSDVMDLSVTSKEFTPDELLDILGSYKQKKRYHRLRSGDFVDLTVDGDLGEIEKLMEDMDLSPEEAIEKGVSLPMYRALYLGKLMEEHESVAANRDREFRSLIKNFNSIRDADYEIPASLEDTLRPYQAYGFKWLRTLESAGFGGILADEMGLGKTLQMISVIYADKESGGNNRPSLIVCPASLVYNWQEEFGRFAPSLHTLVLSGTLSARKAMLEKYLDYDVCITSYDTLKRDILMYRDKYFQHCVLDEAEYIKNPKAAVSKAVKTISADHRFALTGTPIENRLSELWSIFDFLMPGFLYKLDEFTRRFELPIVGKKDEEAAEKLRRMTSPFILRRCKQDVLKDLPDKLEEVRYARLEGRQQQIYNAQVVRLKEMLAQPASSGKDRIKVLAELTRTRQICCDPSLILEDYQDVSAKRTAVMELIESAIDGGHRMLLFSQFTSMLDLLMKDLDKKKIPYYVITGSTPKEKRLSLVHDFNEGDVPVFLISLKAGGTGLNLTGADMVIHYDPWWNLAVQNQATDRAHRIGQTRQVTVYKLVLKDTIEERIIELQELKKDLADAILTGESESITQLSNEELLELLE